MATAVCRMSLQGLGGSNLLHIILALSNSREQIAEGTACLRFGQSCLSMTVNPNANKMEKEQVGYPQLPHTILILVGTV